jgi:hypothetical protein
MTTKQLEAKLQRDAARVQAAIAVRDETIRQASAAGLSYRTIGELVGLSHDKVRRVVVE